MKLYSSNNWENTEDGIWLQTYLEPIFKKGSKALISNVESQLYILHVDNLLIPISVNEKEYHNSYVCSIYSYLLYAEEELNRHRKILLKSLLFPLLSAFKG